MKQQVITFIAAAGLSLSALTQAQGEMPTLGSVEGWGCNMNDGQSMSDLMKVVDDWNEWSDDQGISTYTAWVLNPIFNANADFVGDSIWFGYSPNFTEMGKALQT